LAQEIDDSIGCQKGNASMFSLEFALIKMIYHSTAIE